MFSRIEDMAIPGVVIALVGMPSRALAIGPAIADAGATGADHIGKQGRAMRCEIARHSVIENFHCRQTNGKARSAVPKHCQPEGCGRIHSEK